MIAEQYQHSVLLYTSYLLQNHFSEIKRIISLVIHVACALKTVDVSTIFIREAKNARDMHRYFLNATILAPGKLLDIILNKNLFAHVVRM